MSPNPSPYPTNSSVPMNLYLADRERLDARLDRMENKITERLDGMDSKIDSLAEDRASNLGSQKERRRIAAKAFAGATLFMSFAAVAGRAAGVL